MRRNKIQPLIGTGFVALMHPDIVSDLRNVAAAGDWVDVAKYSNLQLVLQNEVGFFKGFKIIEDANVTINTDAGSTTTDTYHSIFMGYNALGYAESVSNAPHPTLVGETDKLNRFAHFGWYGVFKYGIIEQNAIWVVTSASSFGSN